MTDKSLLKEYKSTISDLTKEKQELNDIIIQKDSKIKKILIQLEQANSDIQSMGSKIGELQEKLNKKQTIKLNIRPMITKDNVLYAAANLIAITSKDPISGQWISIKERKYLRKIAEFEKIDDNIFAAGCYNGSGIGVGTLFGEQIAIKASNEHTKEIEIIESRNKPTRLPPEPFLNFGIKTRLLYERIKARSEI